MSRTVLRHQDFADTLESSSTQSYIEQGAAFTQRGVCPRRGIVVRGNCPAGICSVTESACPVVLKSLYNAHIHKRIHLALIYCGTCVSAY